MKEQILFEEGNVLIEVHQHDKLIHCERVKNLVVTTGQILVRDLILNSGTAPNCFAVGKGTTTTNVGMVALEDEYFRKYFTRKTSGGTRATYQTILTVSEANVSPQAISEAALFSGSSFNGETLTAGGILFARTTFAPIVKDNTMTITYTWDVTTKNA